MNGFHSYPSRPIVGFVVLLLSFFYSTSSYSQIEAIATCDETNITTTSTYVIEVTGLDEGVTYDIIIGTDTTESHTGTTSFESEAITFVDGLQTVDVLIITDPDGANVETSIIVHEALCIDADGDGDLDYNEASCDYRASGPNYGTIVSTVAPYNGENVYLYFLTDSSAVYADSTITSNTGHFTGLANGEYRVSAYTFTSFGEAQDFQDALSFGDDLDDFTGGSDPVCFNFCGEASYTVIDCGEDLLSLEMNVPTDLELCEGMDGDFSGLADISISEPLSSLPTPNDTTYQWLVNDGSGAGFVALTGETDTLLSLTDVDFDMDGNEYQLVASISVNDNVIDSDTSATATLTVREGITLASDLDATVCSGDSSGIMLVLDGTSAIMADSFEIVSITNADSLVAGDSNADEGVTSDSLEIFGDTWTNTESTASDIIYEIVAMTDEGCISDTIEVTLTVSPQPEFTDDLDAEVCSGEIAGITLPSSGNVTIDSFEVSANVGPGLVGTASTGGFTDVDSLFNDTFTNTSGTVDSVVYTVTPYSGDCEGEDFTIVLTVNPVPNVEDINAIVCSDETIDVSLATVDSAGMTIDSFDVAIVSTGDDLVAVNQTMDTGSTDISAIADDVYTNVSGGTDTVIYAITPYVGGCQGDDYMVIVAITTEPVGVDTTVFAASDELLAINLDSLVDGAATYRWFAMPNDSVVGETIDTTNTGNVINDVITNISGASEDVIYTVIAASDQGCVSDTITVTVSICSEPIYSNAEPVTVCSGESLDIDLSETLEDGSNAADGFLYTVSSSDSTAVAAAAARTDTSAANITDTYTNTSSSPVTITYTITPHTDAGCVGDVFTVTVTVNPEPFLADDLDDTVCSGSDIGLVLSVGEGSAAADSFDLVAINPRGLTVDTSSTIGLITANDLSSDSYTNNGENSDSVTYMIAPISADGCRGDTVSVTITVDPEVTVDAGEDETICSTAEVALSGATISGAGVSEGTWSTDGDGSFVDNADSGDSTFAGATTYIPGPNDRAGGEVVLTLTSDDPEGACGTAEDSMTITINGVECGTFPWTGNE